MSSLSSQSLIRLLPTTRYDFSALRGGPITIPVAQRLDVLGYDTAALQLRVLSGRLSPGSTVKVLLADDGHDPDVPDVPLLQTQSPTGEDIASIELTSATVLPFYQTLATTIPGKVGRMMAVLVSFTGGDEGAPSVVLSMDLLLTGRLVGTNVQQPATFRGYAAERGEEPEPFERLAPELTAPVGDDIVERLAEVLTRRPSKRGYPRFSNVNVALMGSGADFDVEDQGAGRRGSVVERLADEQRDRDD